MPDIHHSIVDLPDGACQLVRDGVLIATFPDKEEAEYYGWIAEIDMQDNEYEEYQKVAE